MHAPLLAAAALAFATLLPITPARAEPAEPAATPAGRTIVFGVDRSDTWERMTRIGMALAEQTLLHDLRPGDEIVYRWISDRSYAADQAFAQVRLPVLLAAKGQLDHRGKQEAARTRQALITAARQGQTQLRRFTPEASSANPGLDLRNGTKSTDLIGFLTAAAEQFAQTDASRPRLLIIVSDLEDNRRFPVKPNLAGVEVVVYSVSLRADPAKGQQLQKQWTQFFTQSGARVVEFRPAMVIPEPG
jgi:hypothetical protein